MNAPWVGMRVRVVPYSESGGGWVPGGGGGYLGGGGGWILPHKFLTSTSPGTIIPSH